MDGFEFWLAIYIEAVFDHWLTVIMGRPREEFDALDGDLQWGVRTVFKSHLAVAMENFQDCSYHPQHTTIQ
jgi:hypothetical protein